MRIALLARGMTGYFNECCRQLVGMGNEMLIVNPQSMANTDFRRLDMDSYAESWQWARPPTAGELNARVDRFAPDAVIMQSWSWPKSYRAVMKSRPATVLRILFMDNVWLATPKQWLGRLTHRVYLDPLFDCVMVPGDRTEFFARRLGFAPEDVIRGGWSADVDLFGSPPRPGEDLASRRSFVAAGRLVHHKGADVLAAAYGRYRGLTADPWDLHVVGVGPLESHFSGIPGVRMHGFLQPSDLAQLMHTSSCFVLPSRAEPYGLVVNEAAAASLPMLCTDLAGAVPILLQDGYNGWTVAAGRADLLADAMARISSLPAGRLEEMSAISHSLSKRFSTQGWARNLHEEIVRRFEAGARRRPARAG